HVQEMSETRENKRYLPGFSLPAPIAPTANLETAVRAGSKIVVCAVPSHAVRETMSMVGSFLGKATIVVSATKGIEEGTGLRMSEVIGAAASCGEGAAVLSGPSFAKEVAAEMPTVVTATATELATADFVQHAFASPMFRVYSSTDLVGVEIGG